MQPKSFCFYNCTFTFDVFCVSIRLYKTLKPLCNTDALWCSDCHRLSLRIFKEEDKANPGQNLIGRTALNSHNTVAGLQPSVRTRSEQQDFCQDYLHGAIIGCSQVLGQQQSARTAASTHCTLAAQQPDRVTAAFSDFTVHGQYSGLNARCRDSGQVP